MRKVNLIAVLMTLASLTSNAQTIADLKPEILNDSFNKKIINTPYAGKDLTANTISGFQTSHIIC